MCGNVGTDEDWKNRAINALGERLQAWFDLEEALRGDVTALLLMMERDENNQCLRRALVRAHWGFIEGSIAGLAAFVTEAQMYDPDHEAQREQWLGTLDRVKLTLKQGADIIAVDWRPVFSTAGWQAVRNSLRIRDKLMHPQSAADVLVTDDEHRVASDGAAWFLATVVELQERGLERVGAQ